MAAVHLPRSLVAIVPELPRRIDVEAPDVGELIMELDRRWPGVRDRLIEPGPRIRSHINVFVDGERASLSTSLGPTSTVHVIPSIAGGAGRR
jgi:sulfur-carrier protein